MFRTLEEALTTAVDVDFTCIGGDFNVVLSNLLDKKGGSNKRPASQVYLNKTIESNQLIDTWRSENPTQKRFTWSQRVPPVKCRLDYFLIPRLFVKFMKNTNITAQNQTTNVLNYQST